MTQTEKELLLRDLCARLPYGVKGKCELDASYYTSFDTIFQTHKFDAVVYGLTEDSLFVYPLIEDRDEEEFANEEVAKGIDILDFKPYLFPLSSMTEEQKQYLKNRFCYDWDGEPYDLWKCQIEIVDTEELIDWFNKNRFDYRGLILTGLAIDATVLNIY